MPAAVRTVADAMLRSPKVHGPATTVGELRRLFLDDHVHAALVAQSGRLLAVVDRGDLVGAGESDPAAAHGEVEGRCVGPEEDVEALRRQMVQDGVRRYAVVDAAGGLLGLLCLKRSGRGFCSDADVADRAVERHCAG